MRGIYIGLGANLGDRAGNINRALNQLNAPPFFKLLRVSSFYRSEPWGVKNQPWFLNAVAEIETPLQPHDLLAELKKIERDWGRMPSDMLWGPRVIDLDIILYGEMVINSPTLSIPHLNCLKRLFVLMPLVEMDETLVHPESGKLFRLYLEELEEHQAAGTCLRFNPTA